jgi:7-cyano-7-deazaguanine reductase
MVFDGVTLLSEAIEKKRLPLLETFVCPYDPAIQQGVIRIVFPEFTCVCPKTGYPDFATIILLYLPDTLCIELKSWKLYLNAFRMIGIFHETVTAHIFKTITGLLKPRWAIVVGDFFPRGNVDTTVVFETNSSRPQSADILIGSIKPHCRGITGQSF